MTKKWLAAGLVLAIGACGGSAAEGGGGGDTTPTEDVVPSPPQPWEEMSMDDRKAWMVAEVMPRTAAMFEEFDGERFAGFSCDGCHGADMQETNFAMPNGAIMALAATGTPDQQQMVRDHPQMVRFMFNDLLPTMQTLLGAPDFDEATGEGFSCYACHTRASEVPIEDATTAEETATEGETGEEAPAE